MVVDAGELLVLRSIDPSPAHHPPHPQCQHHVARVQHALPNEGERGRHASIDPTGGLKTTATGHKLVKLVKHLTTPGSLTPPELIVGGLHYRSLM